jgi:hypothetical protein
MKYLSWGFAALAAPTAGRTLVAGPSLALANDSAFEVPSACGTGEPGCLTLSALPGRFMRPDPVQPSVRNRFGGVLGLQVLARLEIRDGAGES